MAAALPGVSVWHVLGLCSVKSYSVLRCGHPCGPHPRWPFESALKDLLDLDPQCSLGKEPLTTTGTDSYQAWYAACLLEADKLEFCHKGRNVASYRGRNQDSGAKCPISRCPRAVSHPVLASIGTWDCPPGSEAPVPTL